MRRGVLPIVGGRIERVSRPRSRRLQAIDYRPSFTALQRGLCGRRIAAAERLGKRLVLVLDSDDRLVIEPRMTGRVMLDPDREFSHVRLVLEVAVDGTRRYLVFRDVRGLGVVHLTGSSEFAAEFGRGRLGPDALEIPAEQLQARLGGRSTPIKVALLDRKALAGVGNIYAAEALHRAKIHPAAPCCSLKPAQWRRLHAALGLVLRRAIELQGSTLRDGTYATPENRDGGYQREFWVYQRAGERCLQCGRGRIRRIVQAQRSTFYCPVCQRAPRGS